MPKLQKTSSGLPRNKEGLCSCIDRQWRHPAADLAHTLSKALAVPVLDLATIDAQRLPKGVIDNKLAAQYQVMVLSKRGNRLFVAGPTPPTRKPLSESSSPLS